MLSNLVILFISFIVIMVIVGVEGPEPVEAWHFCWFLSSEGWKEIQKRDKVTRRINEQKNADLARLIINTQTHERLRREQEREQRRKEFREWKANCDRIFNTVAS